MKIKISDKGALSVNGKQKFCPFQAEASCGDWCPLFGEPVERPTYEESKEISLVLCQTELTCKIEDFEDLR